MRGENGNRSECNREERTIGEGAPGRWNDDRPGHSDSACGGGARGMRGGRGSVRSALGDHPLMQGGDAFAAGIPERKREQRVEKTSHGAAEHPNGKPARGTQVLEVGFADGGRMFGEELAYAHVSQPIETAVRFGCVIPALAPPYRYVVASESPEM